MAGEGARRTVGRYEVIRRLGRGGMAIVYLARQLDLDREVALKELGSFHVGMPDLAERFLRESRLAGSLSHPNIVTVHEYFEQDGVPYIAMEFVPRGSLRPFVGKLSLAQLAGVLEGVLAGLTHAERAGIVHRDLKPENIMVTAEGRVKIADFGIAKASQTAGMTAALTATGAAVGTPTYMAPEQAMAEPVGPWTDLYSVGIMAYEHVTGRPPFHGAATPMIMLMRHVNEPVPPANTVNPDIDSALSDWIDRLLIKDAGARTRRPDQAWDELEEIVIRLVGPRWRRSARLLEPENAVKSSKPLTPAPFPTDEAETPMLRTPEPKTVAPTPQLPETVVAAPASETSRRSRGPDVVTSTPASASRRDGERGDERRPPRRMLVPLGLLVTVVVVAVIVVVAVGGGNKRAGQTPATGAGTGAATHAGALSASTSAIPNIQTTSLSGGMTLRGPIALTTRGAPRGLVVVGRDAWVLDSTHGLIVKVAEDGSELRVHVGSDPQGIAFDRPGGRLWVANQGSDDVTELDRFGAVIKQSIKVGSRPIAVASGLHAVWAADSGDGTVTRIDPRSYATKRIAVGGTPTAIITAFGRVWVAKSDRSITVLTPSGAVNGSVPSLPGPGAPIGLAGNLGVWVVRAAGGGAGGLSRVDPAVAVAVRQTPPYQYAVDAEAPHVGADPLAIDTLGAGLSDGTIWVVSGSDHTLFRIGTQGADTDRVLARIPVGSSPEGVAVYSGVVWVADARTKALYEISY